jgi:hypothetical protein
VRKPNALLVSVVPSLSWQILNHHRLAAMSMCDTSKERNRRFLAACRRLYEDMGFVRVPEL